MSKKKLSLNIGEKDEVTATSGFLDMSQGPLLLKLSRGGSQSSARYTYVYKGTTSNPSGGSTKTYEIWNGPTYEGTGTCADNICP